MDIVSWYYSLYINIWFFSYLSTSPIFAYTFISLKHFSFTFTCYDSSEGLVFRFDSQRCFSFSSPSYWETLFFHSLQLKRMCFNPNIFFQFSSIYSFFLKHDFLFFFFDKMFFTALLPFFFFTFLHMVLEERVHLIH